MVASEEEQLRMALALSASAAAQSPGPCWKCSQCTLENEATATRCGACNAAKPGTQQNLRSGSSWDAMPRPSNPGGGTSVSSGSGWEMQDLGGQWRRLDSAASAVLTEHEQMRRNACVIQVEGTSFEVDLASLVRAPPPQSFASLACH